MLVMRHTKDDKLSSTILNVKEYLRELHSISRFRIYHRDASSDRSARSRELVASHVIARNVEFMNLRATARTIEVGQAHCQDSCPRKKKKKRKNGADSHQRKRMYVRSRNRSQRKDIPEGLTRPTVKLQLFARQQAVYFASPINYFLASSN